VPSEDAVSQVPPATVNCPACGAEVTAGPSSDGDKGSGFRCLACNRLFGIVPGIAEIEEEPLDRD
jgi:transposase-like protein